MQPGIDAARLPVTLGLQEAFASPAPAASPRKNGLSQALRANTANELGTRVITVADARRLMRKAPR